MMSYSSINFPLALATANDKRDLQQNASGKLEFNSIEMVNVNDLTNFAPTAIKITSTNNVTKLLSVNASSQLLYDGSALQLVQDSITGIIATLPLSLTAAPLNGGTSHSIENLFKPSSITAASSLLLTSNNTRGTFHISPVPDNLEFTTLKLKHASSSARNLTADNTGKILYNNSTLATEAYVASQEASASLRAILPLRMNSITLETFFKPSSITAASSLLLTSSNILGTPYISPVPDNFEFPTPKLKDSGNAVRNLTTSTSGDL